MTEAVKPVLFIRPAVLQEESNMRETPLIIKFPAKGHLLSQVTIPHLLEVFTGDISLVAEPTVDVNNHGGDDGEGDTEAEDHGVTDSLTHYVQRGKACKTPCSQRSTHWSGAKASSPNLRGRALAAVLDLSCQQNTLDLHGVAPSKKDVCPAYVS